MQSIELDVTAKRGPFVGFVYKCTILSDRQTVVCVFFYRTTCLCSSVASMSSMETAERIELLLA